LTCIHKKAGFPVWEELFTAVNGYLVNHSSSDIFGDTVTFPDPENVDFDVLHVILLTFWINFNMRYCVSGGHLEFSHLGSFPQVFTVAFFLAHSVFHLHNNFCDTACPANSPLLGPHLPGYCCLALELFRRVQEITITDSVLSGNL